MKNTAMMTAACRQFYRAAVLFLLPVVTILGCRADQGEVSTTKSASSEMEERYQHYIDKEWCRSEGVNLPVDREDSEVCVEIVRWSAAMQLLMTSDNALRKLNSSPRYKQAIESTFAKLMSVTPEPIGQEEPFSMNNYRAAMALVTTLNATVLAPDQATCMDQTRSEAKIGTKEFYQCRLVSLGRAAYLRRYLMMKYRPSLVPEAYVDTFSQKNYAETLQLKRSLASQQQRDVSAILSYLSKPEVSGISFIDLFRGVDQVCVGGADSYHCSRSASLPASLSNHPEVKRVRVPENQSTTWQTLFPELAATHQIIEDGGRQMRDYEIPDEWENVEKDEKRICEGRLSCRRTSAGCLERCSEEWTKVPVLDTRTYYLIPLGFYERGDRLYAE